MSRKIIPPEEVDEDFLLNLASGVLFPPVSVRESKSEPESKLAPKSAPDPDPLPDPVQAFAAMPDAAYPTASPDGAANAGSGKRRKILLPDYEAVFLQGRNVRNRVNVCVSMETRDKLALLVKAIGPANLSISGYAENVLRHHLDTFRDEINRLNQARRPIDIL